MKKIAAMLLSLVFALSLSSAALAAENSSSESSLSAENAEVSTVAETDFADSIGGAYVGNDVPRLSDGIAGTGDITSPLDYWNVNGWPDDVSFACEAGGEMAEDGTILAYWEIGLVNASDERRQEIVDQFAETCLITFHDAKWSHNQREAVLLEIEVEVKENNDRNFVSGILIKNTEKVYIVVKDEAFEEYSARYAERYGELVWTQRESEMVEAEIYAVDPELGMMLDGGMQTNQITWFVPVLLCTFVIVAAAVLFSNRYRLVPIRQTVTGGIETDIKPLSRAQTVHAVQERTYSPSDKVLESIMDELKR